MPPATVTSSRLSFVESMFANGVTVGGIALPSIDTDAYWNQVGALEHKRAEHIRALRFECAHLRILARSDYKHVRTHARTYARTQTQVTDMWDQSVQSVSSIASPTANAQAADQGASVATTSVCSCHVPLACT